MTVVPLNLHEPLMKFKRIMGVVVVTMGAFVLLATMAWLVADFAGRGVDLAALEASFGSEFGFWSPVLIFNVPGLLLVFHGARMMRDAPLSLLEAVEVLALLVTTIAVVFIALEPNA